MGASEHNSSQDIEAVTFMIDGRWFGARVQDVHDVFKLGAMTPVPLARADVAGLLNLRGRIVTAIDARRRLGLTPRAANSAAMAIGVERDGEPYAVIVDLVGEVMRLPLARREAPPASLDETWREITLGVYRIEVGLLVELDLARLLDPPGGGGLAA